MKVHPRQPILTLAVTAFAILGFTTTSASAQIIIDDTLPVLIGVGNQGTTGLAIVASYDASKSDKLVVVVSTEHAFGTNAGMSINSVEYNGQAMIEAVQENTTPGTAAIFYLDSPGPAGEIRIFQGNQNGGRATVYALSNVAPGLGGFGQSITNSVDVITTSPNDLVIACILDGGQAANGNGAGAPTAALPLIQDHSGTWGRSWGGHGAGHQFIASPGIATSTFTTAGPNLLRNVAVAFHECTARTVNYGAGLAGTNGVPTLTTSAPPVFGQSIGLQGSNSSGVAASGLLITGLQSISVPFLGGMLLADTTILTPMVISAGGFSLPVTIPTIPCGIAVYLQALQLDQAAVAGVSMSPGLQLVPGT